MKHFMLLCFSFFILCGCGETRTQRTDNGSALFFTYHSYTPSQLVAHPDGTHILLKHINTTIPLGDEAITPASNAKNQENDYKESDIALFAFEKEHRVLWQKRIGNGEANDSHKMLVGPNQDLYIIGSFVGTMSIDEVSITSGMITNSNGSTSYLLDFFVARLDKTGKLVWLKQSQSNSGAGAYSLSVDKNGNVFLSGGFGGRLSMEGKTLEARTGHQVDTFVAKLDQAGNPVWLQHAVPVWELPFGQYRNVHQRVGLSSQGELYLTGTFQGEITWDGQTLKATPSTQQGQPAQDIFVAKLDQDGKLEWLKGFGGEHQEQVDDMVIHSSGTISLIGSFTEKTTFGTFNASATNLLNPTKSGVGLWLATFSKDGDVQALDVIETNATSYPKVRMASHTNDSVIVTGSYQGKVRIGGKITSSSEQPPYKRHVYISKYSAKDGFEWTLSSGSIDGEYRYPTHNVDAIDLDTEGQLLMSGTFRGSFLLRGLQLVPAKETSEHTFVIRMMLP
ncbi:MAG: hypothetical protein CL932_04835 [Deltaproteobacteria bacterium]|nr:hypothetical protein [Deltaproteobacteria bacterium]|tara:strand:+ start:78 stop:1598 length:1521 start_codon:yes stop_codon:yes gene_type:complete